MIQGMLVASKTLQLKTYKCSQKQLANHPFQTRRDRSCADRICDKAKLLGTVASLC